MVAGIELANSMSKNGDSPVNHTPVATTVVVCPTWQQGPAAGMPVSDPPVAGQVPPGQAALTPHGRLALLLHTRVVRGPALNIGREHESPFRSVNLALVVPVVGLRMKRDWLTGGLPPRNIPPGA